MICIPRPASLLRVTVAIGLSSTLFGQFRGGSDWSTRASDAQRTSWIRTDAKISPTTVNASTFQLLWKTKLGNEPLSAPVLLDHYIGYRGFRTYAFIGGSAEDAFALDTDVGKLEWQKHLSTFGGVGAGSCPGGMTASLTRPVSGTLPQNVASRFGGGRGGPAKSGVGEPLEGAVTLAQVTANQPPTPAASTPAANKPATPPARPPGGFTPRPTLMWALSGDGAVHTMYVSNGEEAAPPISFLPAGANVSDFSVVDGIAYATTTGRCGGAADGIRAVDLTSKNVGKWDGPVNGLPAFGPDGTYLTTGTKLVNLDSKTLVVGGSYDPGVSFTTSPVVFQYKSKVMIAAVSKDGVVHLVDSSSPAVAAAKSAAGDVEPYALATWQTVAETRWLLATSPKSITGWKIVEQNGAPAIQRAWTINEVTSPSAPLIINGVLFALDRGDRGHNAKLSAFDASTGEQLWDSGHAVTSFVGNAGGLAAGGSSLYFGTQDGTIWAFGFPIEH